MRARFKSKLASYLERTHQINIDLDFISDVMLLFKFVFHSDYAFVLHVRLTQPLANRGLQ